MVNLTVKINKYFRMLKVSPRKKLGANPNSFNKLYKGNNLKKNEMW